MLTDGIVEGAMTVVFGIICFFFMPDTPAAAGFLTDEEKEWALLRMRIDAGGSTAAAAVDDEKFSWYWAKMALKAPQTYLCSFIWFFLLVPLYVSTIPNNIPSANGYGRLELHTLPSLHYLRYGLPIHHRTALHGSTQHGCFLHCPHHGILLGQAQKPWLFHRRGIDSGHLRIHYAPGCKNKRRALCRHILGRNRCLPRVAHDHGNSLYYFSSKQDLRGYRAGSQIMWHRTMSAQ